MTARHYDKRIDIDASALEPMITFGTNPGMGIPITAAVPDPSSISDPVERDSLGKALRYMDLPSGKSLLGHPINVCSSEAARIRVSPICARPPRF